MTGELLPLVERALETGGGAVERVVFGTDAAADVAAAITDLCETTLGARVEAGLSYASSVGCVAALEVADGRRVVVKAYQPRWTAAFLRAVARVQAHLAVDGFPCPRPLAGPVRVGTGHALIEEHVADPGPSTITPATRRASARGLCEVVERGRRLDGQGLSPHPLDAPAGSLYPEPHSPLFDFEATAEGAEWIDEIARRARAVRDGVDAPRTIAHCDWSARNVRLAAGGVLVAYDWDSLALVLETTAVGQAAATWSAHGEPGEEAPTVGEIAAYVADYEGHRNAPFTDNQRDAVGAAALWVLAYTARCEHAIDPRGVMHRRARPRIAADADYLVRLSRCG